MSDETMVMPAAPAAAPTNETREERLGRLRREKADRDLAREREDEEREIAELELDAELAATVGKRGQDYEIVNTAFGVFGVQKPDDRGTKQFSKATSDTENLDPDKLAGILRHYIVPEGRAQVAFHAAATDRPDVAFRVATAVRSLLGSEKLNAKKKF